MRTKKHRQGFTLVEMLVVISIIALLLGVLLPSIGGAREQAKKLVCQAHLRQISDMIWAYSVENDDRVPYVISPLTNGGGIGPEDEPVPGFLDPEVEDATLDPYDFKLWPMSMPNVLLPRRAKQARKLFTCPSADFGYPRLDGPLTMTYRPASANQLSGVVDETNTYVKEHFGFLDGRKLRIFRPDLISDPRSPYDYMHNAQQKAFGDATYLRDMVQNTEDILVGPHDRGVNVINRRFEVEYRDFETLQAQLKVNDTGTVDF